MKKVILIGLLITNLTLFGQTENGWSWGGGLGMGGSRTIFSGGNSFAHARFQPRSHSTLNLFLSVRRDINNHWAVMGSLEVRNLGFEYALYPEEYSLKNKSNHYVIRHEQSVLQLSLMGLYKTTPDCKNKRWIFGLGLVPALTGKSEVTSKVDIENAPSGNLTYAVTSQFSEKAFCFGKWMLGREKKFRNGNLFHWGLEHVFIPQAAGKSIISYSVNGKEYMHEYTCTGNYTGLFFRWLFGYPPKNTGSR